MGPRSRRRAPCLRTRRVSIVVVCEADADRRTACTLADRVLCETVDWMVPETIEHLRQYRGIHAQEPSITNARSSASTRAPPQTSSRRATPERSAMPSGYSKHSPAARGIGKTLASRRRTSASSSSVARRRVSRLILWRLKRDWSPSLNPPRDVDSKPSEGGWWRPSRMHVRARCSRVPAACAALHAR